ncbi:MAG: hypothetical protein K2X48_09970 [Chitinophagaceae bacterium]|nr:hypothetical protein [Chitinophagaceae bacterium]
MALISFKRISVFSYVFACAFAAIARQPSETGMAEFKTGPAELGTGAAVLQPVLFAFDREGSILIAENNITLLHASVKHKMLHGSWQSRYLNSQLLDSGNIIKGIPDGVWKTWYPGGQLKTLRTYNANLFFSIKNDIELNHPRISRFTVTERFKKEGRSALQVFQPSYSFNTIPKIKPITPVELVKQNNHNPSAYHPPFNASLHHGLFINYFQNGLAKDSGYYKEGLKEGVWIYRLSENGNWWRGMYQHGLKQKEWKMYNAAGELKAIVFYNNKGEINWRRNIQ